MRKPLALAIALGISCAAGGVAGAQTIELSDLNGTNGFVITGVAAFDRSGYSVSGAGDVNGDGIDDVVIGTPCLKVNCVARSYVVFGRHGAVAASLDPSALTGADGFVINGKGASDRAGVSVSGAGDVNGDGIDDVIMGAYQADPNGNYGAGESYVVFGDDGGFAASLEVSTLNGANGFVIKGIDMGDRSGRSVSGAGDINGDGIDDLIIGAADADPNSGKSGESYVVFGKSTDFAASLELSALDGTNGFVINGNDLYERLGRSVSGAGDVNGDGFDDVIIGAPHDYCPADKSYTYCAPVRGRSYVVFGHNGTFAASLEASALDGVNGFLINGATPGDYSGTSVSGAGDVNGDGIDDLIIGAPLGLTYVVFGGDGEFKPSLELSALNGANGFSIDGGTGTGRSVSGAGDVNGDGIDDLIIGARSPDFDGGDSYVVFGTDGGFAASLELSALDGANGFVLNGIANPRDLSTHSVSGAGDVNGDGIDDLIIGAYEAEPGGISDAGESYVVFGFETPFFADGFED